MYLCSISSWFNFIATIMKRNFIIDKEVILSDETDFLQTRVYAKNLTDIINNTPQNKAFTIGLFGGWGTGKSSIIETSKNEFNPTKTKFITYDAWKYSNDSFRRMFLRKLRKELEYDETDLMKKFYENESTDVGNDYKLSGKKVIGILLFLLLLYFLYPLFFNYIESETKISISTTVSIIALIFAVASGAFYSLKISVSKPHLFAPEQFEDCFTEIVQKSLKKGVVNKVRHYITGNGMTDLDKLVIVIDNIDRCSSSLAYKLLTDIKTFLSKEEFLDVFIIPVDDEALRKHILNVTPNTEDKCNKEKEEFLRKFFNVTLRIKPYGAVEIFKFAKSINDFYELGFNAETLNIVSKEFASNPRRIIQLLNNLTAELNSYPEDFASKYETIICIILIIREEYGDFYKEILFNQKYLTENYETKNYELDAFLRLTRQITKNVEINIVDKILTNATNLFNGIPAEIQNSIITFDLEKVNLYIEQDKSKLSGVLLFVRKKIADAFNNGIKSEKLNYIQFLARINDKFQIDEGANQIFNDIFLSYGYYNGEIHRETEYIDSICFYAQSLFEQGFGGLKRSIFEYLNGNLSSADQNQNFEKYVKSSLKIFNNEKDSKSFAPFFEKYIKTRNIDKDIPYSDFQLIFMFTENILEEKIGRLSELKENNADDLLWLFKNKLCISKSNYASLFQKVDTLIGDIRNKSKEDILLYIDFLMPFIENVEAGFLGKEPLNVFGKLLNSRSMSINTYNHSTKNLIDECLENEEESHKIIDFILHIYIISDVDVSEKLSALYPKYKAYINGKLVNDAGEKYLKLCPIILTADNYDSDDTLILTKKCLCYKNKNEEHVISEEQIKNKIKSLLDAIPLLSNSTLVNTIINISEDDAYIRDIIISDVANRRADFVNNLPKELLDIALGSFTFDRYLEYSDNYPFCATIAAHGSQEQVNLLVKILSQKLTQKEDIPQILDIIESIKQIGDTDADLLKASLMVYLNDDINAGKDIKDRIDRTVSMLSNRSKS